MTLTTMLFLTLTGSLILLKLGLIVFALLLLVRATMRAGHPGSMDPNFAEIPVECRLQGSYRQ
ncbi:MAG: hypothetical protein B6D72_13605 [gamma proteobacterium symbiont of Ctena orbiculata]|nr:MAG: hypothetical protein DBP00_07440 [gamma proteobacterium symbiont of Ctena orbiculata]PVV09758.1 MAG: hypothetical protein B6D72_13605 [gamma proteobacterium symbiont of Ctena orbiculata]PVV10080.1 MAG: hypothetical protein B6D82_13090 [gamma proteobacterium symbiont of Ctena orbiculata]